jgi:hypothetical protein
LTDLTPAEHPDYSSGIHGSIWRPFVPFAAWVYGEESPIFAYTSLLAIADGAPTLGVSAGLAAVLALEALLVAGLMTTVARTVWFSDEGMLVEERGLNRNSLRLIRWERMTKVVLKRLLPGSVTLYPGERPTRSNCRTLKRRLSLNTRAALSRKQPQIGFSSVSK